MPDFLRQVPRAFNAPVLAQIAETGSSAVLAAILKELPHLQGNSLAAVYDDLYALLVESYRCEYVFKNQIAHELLLKRHTHAEARLLSELRVGTCKADTVIVNGTSSVYEIKTELDTLDRLPRQIAAYRDVFDRVCVVSSGAILHRLVTEIPHWVGILELKQDGGVEVVRQAASNLAHLKPGSIFCTLRQPEYLAALRAEFGHAPDVPNGIRWRVCRDLFATLPPERAHARMVEALRRRDWKTDNEVFVDGVPRALKHAALTSTLSPRKRVSLVDRLARPVAWRGSRSRAPGLVSPSN
jgi:hypothetical protein